jgi:hypothetical protein
VENNSNPVFKAAMNSLQRQIETGIYNEVAKHWYSRPSCVDTP